MKAGEVTVNTFSLKTDYRDGGHAHMQLTELRYNDLSKSRLGF